MKQVVQQLTKLFKFLCRIHVNDATNTGYTCFFYLFAFKDASYFFLNECVTNSESNLYKCIDSVYLLVII